MSGIWVISQISNSDVETLSVSDPEILTQLAIYGISGFVIAYLSSLILVWLLRSRQFDELFTPPWKPLYAADYNTGLRASSVVGWGFFASVLILTAWQFRQTYPAHLPWVDVAISYSQQFWLILLTCLVALAIARFIAGAILSVFQNPSIRTQLELMCPHEPQELKKSDSPAVSEQDRLLNLDEDSENDLREESATESDRLEQDSVELKLPRVESIADTVARLVGLIVYLLVFLPVLMIASEIWGWTVTGSTVGEVWQWLLPFAGLAAVITIGWFALTAAAISVCPAEFRKPVMILTTVSAVILLSVSYNISMAILVTVAVVVICWFSRKELPDVVAGLYLKFQKSLELKTPDGPAVIQNVGLLLTRIQTETRTANVRNRHVLQACLSGNTLEESRMITSATEQKHEK